MINIKKNNPYHIIHINFSNFNVSLLNYGAAIKQIQSPDIHGEMADLLLEYKDLSDYDNNDIYLNATIAPITGRIRNGLIEANNQIYSFQRNQENKHTLHSGNHTLSFQFFDYDIQDSENEAVITFSKKVSLFDDISYKMKIIYTIKRNEMMIRYRIDANKDFIFNVTNHAYFNLSGNLKEPINNHVLQLDTHVRHKLDQDQLSTGKLIDEATYNFAHAKPLDKALRNLADHPFKGFDDIYFYPNHRQDLPMAIVYEPMSQRQLDVYSSYDHLLFYTHNNICDLPLKHLNDHKKHYGLCFECQKGPIGFIHPNAKDTRLKSSSTYDAYILFKFSVKK